MPVTAAGGIQVFSAFARFFRSASPTREAQQQVICVRGSRMVPQKLLPRLRVRR